ncbi:AFG1-like ATPase-domain-containing protein [Nemania sp. FL0916]|nr:AFG1-like ATPase-domain-containing protein [Nemania sp. FL0916]
MRAIQRNGTRRLMSYVAITDPLTKYQSLLATGYCRPDPAQHRLALHLRKVYYRLKDYSPRIEYRTRLNAITNALNQSKKSDESTQLATESHPIWRNPLFTRLFARSQSRDALALTRVLSSYEEAIHIDSPQGLFLSGEVGTGKSMLLDLLADGLPTSRKRRWHFNTFMLYALSQLENHRKINSGSVNDEQQYSLLWLAREMIEKSPILFMDEFQLPDRAASKILSNLFTVFFQLGGVLIASSNRMPEELEKATGFESITPIAGGLIGRALAFGRARGKSDWSRPSSEFASFLQVLKARCEFWQMEGAKDWRRRDSEFVSGDDQKNREFQPLSQSRTETPPDHLLLGDEEIKESSGVSMRPKEYYLAGPEHDQLWDAMLNNHRVTFPHNTDWKAATITVYGRSVSIPRQRDGVVLWDFQELVSSFGPADYISMASTYHTFIVDNVPVLVLLMKNEARRLITLLDALYEARCKLIVRAAVGPDDLFFPDAQHSTTSSSRTAGLPGSRQKTEHVDADAIHSETISEAYQDQTSPFRPNVSTYTDPSTSGYDPDQDSDFGVDPKKSRVDFSNTSAFTGEDERFAYKRAASRLWELCGERWHARQGDWWHPLPIEARHWEGGRPTEPQSQSIDDRRSNDVTIGTSVELDEPAGLQKFRVEHLRKNEGYEK